MRYSGAPQVTCRGYKRRLTNEITGFILEVAGGNEMSSLSLSIHESLDLHQKRPRFPAAGCTAAAAAAAAAAAVHLHLHLGHLADTFIQSDLQRVHLLKESSSRQ